ncbi:MAG TPA: PEP-CTERM sorting domain-containing protein [Tepidisphaeraceae bacterium]|jgi:hypothetical protein
MLGKNLRRISVLAVPAALTFAAATAVQAQVYTPSQSTLLAFTDESAGFGDGGHVNSVTPDLNGGVIVSINFGALQANGRPTGLNPWVPFDVTYFGPNLDLSAFTDSEVSISLLPGSAESVVDVQPFIQGGNSSSFAFFGMSGAPAEVFPTIGGPAILSDSNFAAHPSGGFTAAGTDNIRWGFQVFPQPVYSAPDAFGTGPELIEIDPVVVPEPASLGLLGLAVPALLARRRNASK